MLSFEDIAKIFENIELRLIASLKRNLQRHKAEEQKEGFQWSAWQAEKLRNMEKFRRENLSIMNEYTDVIDEQTRQLMVEQFQEGEELVNSQLEEIRQNEPKADSGDIVTHNNFFGVNNEKMQSLMTDITSLEKRVETAALRMTDDVYRQTVNKVQLAMATGSMNLNEALDIAVKDFLDKGINCIVYSDGKHVNIADYVRMALRTTSARASLQGQAKRFAQLGYDTVLVSQYGGCSKTCEPWQGKVYIDDVFTPWEGEHDEYQGKSNYCGQWFWLLSYAISNGLFHPNCRHTISQYIHGVTKIPEPIAAEKIKKQRELEEKQRAMERRIRKLKRFSQGTFSPDTAKAYRKKLREAQQELKAFVDEHNDVLRRDYSREKYYGGSLTDKEKDDIIKAEIRKIGFRGNIHLRPELPDLSNVSIDSQHIKARGHNVTLDQAVEYIRSSKVMIAKWNGTVYNYYSEKGASYLHPLNDNTIRTAFSADEYDENIRTLMEVLKKYGV